MGTHVARGNAAEAVRVYDDVRRLFRDELGIAPGASVQEVHKRLLGA
jgi:DNA-binding SARP family transcriptional activator